MKEYNVIIVYSADGKSVLLCHRTKEPYYGLYNLVGGKLSSYVELVEESHPLHWIPIDGTNFFDMSIFAGEGNIGHMLEIAKNEIANLSERGC